MIKYLRDKIIGRPIGFSHADDLLTDDNLISLKKTSSQNDLTLINSTEPTNQIDKLSSGGNVLHHGRRSVPSSSPIVIPKKPPRSNASSQSSSSYTSIVDQSSSWIESSVQPDDGNIVLNPTLPTLPSTSQQLEHSAARDRISVKNKRRQPLKQKLSTLRETDDNDNNLFSLKNEVISSTPDEEPPIGLISHTESKKPQPFIDLSDLDSARARLRVSVRSRDRSADNILLATHTNLNNTVDSETSSLNAPAFHTSMQRSFSFKRIQENSNPKLIDQIKKINENVINIHKPIENNSSFNDLTVENVEQVNSNSPDSVKSRSRSSSQEHIYDNLDVFKRPKHNIISPSKENESPSATPVKTRDHPISTPRLRPVTVHVPTTNDQQMPNEFENVFNLLKKRGSIRRVHPNENIQPESPSAPIEEKPPVSPPIVQPKTEPNDKPIETVCTPPTPNRRRTVVGVHLSANNKVATNDNKPTPSWIDIAKQKQTKFQLVSSNEKKSQEDNEQKSPIESPVIARKLTPVDARLNRKSMFEQHTSQATTHAIERDSIRALKAGNPNRINNLIQFFDK